jgi:hypothetical protein
MAEIATNNKSQLLYSNIVQLLYSNTAKLKIYTAMLAKQHNYFSRFSANVFTNKVVMFLNYLLYRCVTTQQRSIYSHPLQHFIIKSSTANERAKRKPKESESERTNEQDFVIKKRQKFFIFFFTMYFMICKVRI